MGRYLWLRATIETAMVTGTGMRMRRIIGMGQNTWKATGMGRGWKWDWDRVEGSRCSFSTTVSSRRQELKGLGQDYDQAAAGINMEMSRFWERLPLCSPVLTGLALALISTPPAPPPALLAPNWVSGVGGGAGDKGTDDWAETRGLRSPSAGSLRCCGRLPVLGPDGGKAAQGAASCSLAARGGGPGQGHRGSGKRKGPLPQLLCPCAPPSELAVAEDGRWPVAEEAPGPLGTELNIDSNLPLPNGKKESLDSQEGRAVGCGW